MSVAEFTAKRSRDLSEIVGGLVNEHVHTRHRMLFRGQRKEYVHDGVTSLLPTGLRPGRTLYRPPIDNAVCNYLAHYISCYRKSFSHLGLPFHDCRPFFGEGPSARESFMACLGEVKSRGSEEVFELVSDAHVSPFVEAVYEHYGLPTTVLNVSFNFEVAAFFALHRLEPQGNRWRYVRSDEDGVIYVFLVPDGCEHYVDLADRLYFDPGTRLNRQLAGALYVPSEEPNLCLRYLRYRICVSSDYDCRNWDLFPAAPDTAELDRVPPGRALNRDYLLGFLKLEAADQVLDVADYPHSLELYEGRDASQEVRPWPMW